MAKVPYLPGYPYRRKYGEKLIPNVDGYQIICAWCQKFVGGNQYASEVTTTICKTCKEKVLAELEEKRDEKG